MRNAAIPAIGEEEHLVFPCICVQWPAMAEDHGLTLAPVLVVDLRPVFYSDERHFCSPLMSSCLVAKPHVQLRSASSGLFLAIDPLPDVRWTPVQNHGLFLTSSQKTNCLQ